jgi:hypothetical protein
MAERIDAPDSHARGAALSHMGRKAGLAVAVDARRIPKKFAAQAAEDRDPQGEKRGAAKRAQ